MTHYEMDELLPIVAELAEKYTSKESTSVSYERARQLMEAVLYCIQQCEMETIMSGQEKGAKNQIYDIGQEKVSAREAYRQGYETVIQKVKKTQLAYNDMIINFCAYGNENYYDTVTKAILGFFQYYDVRFAPQETMITMDYPTICPITGCCGIDAIEKYIEYISYEQQFLGALPEAYIRGILYRFQADYSKQFYNICSIVLRHILGCMMIGKAFKLSSDADTEQVYENETKQNYEKLCQIVKSYRKNELKSYLLELLKKLIQEKYNNNFRLYDYLQQDVEDFTSRLLVGVEYNHISKLL